MHLSLARPLFGAILLAAFSQQPVEAQADLCLSPARLDGFLAQESSRDLRGFLAATEQEPSERVCRITDARLCFRDKGVYALWSNNAASVWVGPLIGGEDEARYVEDRLTALTERARSLTQGGDYAGAAAGRVVLREGECLIAGGDAGRADPQLLYAIGREAVRLEEARARLEGLSAEAYRPAAGATRELLDDIAAAALAEVDAAFGAEPGRPEEDTLPLGRAADGLLRSISLGAAEQGDARRFGAGGGEVALSVEFARWLARVTEIGLTASDIASSERPVVARLALLGYLRAPDAYEDLAAWIAPASPAEDTAEPAAYFTAIAAQYRALDALAAFADAWASEGPLRKLAGEIAAFARSLPEGVRARLESLPTGGLFALSQESEELPPVTDLQRLALAGMRQPVIAERAASAASGLGRAGLALTVRSLADETGIALDPEKLAAHLARAEHREVAGRILRATLLQAFAENSATMRHIEALASGRFDDFATALLATAIKAELTARGDAERSTAQAPDGVAAALLAGRPYGGLQAALEPASEGLGPSRKRALAELLDGRTGAAAVRVVRSALEKSGLTARDAEAVLAGNAVLVLERRLADAAGLGEDQLAALRAGAAPDYVRRRAAVALAGEDEDDAEAMLEALGARPQAVLDAERDKIETRLLASLQPESRALPDSLAALAEPLRRRSLAAAILASDIGDPQLASQAVMARLFADDRSGALEAALAPLLGEVPGGAALLAGEVEPYRRGVAIALKEAVARALGGAAAERLLDEDALVRLRQGDVAAIGRSYAQSLLSATGLEPQTRAQLLAGEEAAAWRHEGRMRGADANGRISPSRRIAHALWRMEAAIDLASRALARQRLIHGIVLPGEGADSRELN